MSLVFAAIVAVAAAQAQPAVPAADNKVVATAPKQQMVELLAKPATPALMPFKAGDQINFPKIDASVVGAFNDDMMAIYYLYIVYFTLAKEVAVAGGWIPPKGAPGATLERMGMKFMAHPIEKLHKHMLKSLEREDDVEEEAPIEAKKDEEEKSDEESAEEPSMLQLQVAKKGKLPIPGLKKLTNVDFVTVTCKFLDLAANWHITANTYMGLAMDFKALRAPKYTTFLSFWTNTVKLHWQWCLIYTDWLTIVNEYVAVPFLPAISAYTLRTFDAFVMMWWTSSAVNLYISMTTPMKTAKAALGFVLAANGLELTRVLKSIALISYLIEFKVPCATVFKGLIPFWLADFSIRIFWNSATTRAVAFMAK